MKTQERESHGLCFVGHGEDPIVWEAGQAQKLWVVEYAANPSENVPSQFYSTGAMHKSFEAAVAFAVEDRLRAAKAIIAAFEGYKP